MKRQIIFSSHSVGFITGLFSSNRPAWTAAVNLSVKNLSKFINLNLPELSIDQWHSLIRVYVNSDKPLTLDCNLFLQIVNSKSNEKQIESAVQVLQAQTESGYLALLYFLNAYFARCGYRDTAYNNFNDLYPHVRMMFD